MISNTTGAAGAGTVSGNDVESNVRNLAGKAKDKLNKVVEDVKSFGDDAEVNGREVAEQARAQFDKAAERAERHVRENPVSSALMLLGVGLVAGFVLRGANR